MRSQSLIICALVISCYVEVEACGPGRGGGRRLMRRKYPPLVQRQYIPGVSENTLGASGQPEGAIKRKDKRFRELVQNRNPDIEFRDDEGTGADRMMSQRLKEKLSTLAISVMNQWPNVKLRVIEGWDEDNKHSPNSLHYEGRAVDITTNDKDRSKYGMLARLAVEAGFDWVHYESRSHVHCSVKSEKADSIRNNGCFDAASLLETPNGQVQISDLQANDLVLTMDPQTGQLKFSPFLMWLDRDDSAEELFVELTTKSNRVIRLTSSHLIYLADEAPAAQIIDLAPKTTTLHLQDIDSSSPSSSVGSLLAAAKVLVANGSNDNDSTNYYQYEVAGHTEESSGVETRKTFNGSTAVPGSAQTPANVVVVDQQQSPNIVSSAVRSQQRPPTIDELAYTTYARNSLVGQYLLINEQRALSGDGDADGADGGHGQQAAGTTGEEPSNRPANRLIIPKSTFASRIGPSVKFDQIVKVNFVTGSGRFAPLTREGNIVVNSVVASCYAVISDHDMAHLSFAPIRWLSYLQEWLFGLEQPSTRRTWPNTDRPDPSSNLINEPTSYKLDTQQQLGKGRTEKFKSISRLDTREAYMNNQHRVGVHWYPQLLYRIARYILPTRFLY